MGSSGNETVLSALKDLVLPCACFKGDENVKVKILDGVSGVLKPGRLTLVLGPPGSGKSVFMQTLSGRLVKGRHLRIDGSIRYNGEDIDDFVVQRTAGYVDQHDRHIPNLTVLETTQFAAHCQIPSENVVFLLAGVKEQLHKLRKSGHSDMSQAMAELGRYVCACITFGIGQSHSH